MNGTSNNRIVLGVSSAGSYEGALQFAVDEALRLRCGLTVVHALSESLAPPPDSLIAFGGDLENRHHFVDRPAAQAAYELVNEVGRRARAMARNMVDVDTKVPSGRKVHTIIEAAADARLIVLQHRDLSVFGRILTPSTSVRVASRSHSPVVIVPSPWYPRSSRNRVTVGIDDINSCDDVLRVAFESAEARIAGLDVVHSWTYLGAGSDVMTYGALTEEIRQNLIAQLDQVLAPWRRDFPTVTVEQHVVRDNAAEALLGYSQTSDLLVLGRRNTALPLPLPLGAVARTLLNSSHCPVEIVPQGRPRRRDHEDVDQAHDHV